MMPKRSRCSNHGRRTKHAQAQKIKREADKKYNTPEERGQAGKAAHPPPPPTLIFGNFKGVKASVLRRVESSAIICTIFAFSNIRRYQPCSGKS